MRRLEPLIPFEINTITTRLRGKTFMREHRTQTIIKLEEWKRKRYMIETVHKIIN